VLVVSSMMADSPESIEYRYEAEGNQHQPWHPLRLDGRKNLLRAQSSFVKIRPWQQGKHNDPDTDNYFKQCRTGRTGLKQDSIMTAAAGGHAPSRR
jgi:hypothetical protein